MPGVRGPVKKRDKEENDRQAIALAKQAMTEFAALVIEEQEITGRRDDEDRPPHSAEGSQEVAALDIKTSKATHSAPAPSQRPTPSAQPNELVISGCKRSQPVLSGG